MRVLIDIGHPAHVHLLRNVYKILIERKHYVLVTVKDIDSAKDLLKLYNIPFIQLGKKKDSLFQKSLNQIRYNLKILSLVREHKIDIGIGSSMTLAHISRISKMKSIFLDDDDDDVQPLTVKYAHPFADIILSPDVLKGKRKTKKCLFYPGYHELAYLHPNNFKPNSSVLKEVGLKRNEPFFIMRFNAFKAHHDVGVSGLSLEQKLKLVDILKSRGKIFITTERNIEPELKEYQLKVSPIKAHSLMYYATMFLGDSQTMTSEAAVMGVPAIRCNSFAGRISYLEEEEKKYNLTYGFLPKSFDKMLEKVKSILDDDKVKETWKERRESMLNDKIDVTNFFVWFIENFPSSINIVKNNKKFDLKFS